jgi:hypothetical protein
LFSISLGLEEILEAILDGLKSILDYDAGGLSMWPNLNLLEVQRSTRSEMAAPIAGSGGHPIGVCIWNPMERTLDVAMLFYVEV